MARGPGSATLPAAKHSLHEARLLLWFAAAGIVLVLAASWWASRARAPSRSAERSAPAAVPTAAPASRTATAAPPAPAAARPAAGRLQLVALPFARVVSIVDHAPATRSLLPANATTPLLVTDLAPGPYRVVLAGPGPDGRTVERRRFGGQRRDGVAFRALRDARRARRTLDEGGRAMTTRRLRNAVLPVFLGALVPSSGLAQTDSALLSKVSFNLTNPGGKSLAMGGAFTAIADDATAALANPAGLGLISSVEFAVSGKRTDETLGLVTARSTATGSLAAPYPPIETSNVDRDTRTASFDFAGVVVPLSRRLVAALTYAENLRFEGDAGASGYQYVELRDNRSGGTGRRDFLYQYREFGSVSLRNRLLGLSLAYRVTERLRRGRRHYPEPRRPSSWAAMPAGRTASRAGPSSRPRPRRSAPSRCAWTASRARSRASSWGSTPTSSKAAP